MKVTKSYRLDEVTLSKIAEIREEYHYDVTATHVVETSIDFLYSWLILGGRAHELMMSHIKLSVEC